MALSQSVSNPSSSPLLVKPIELFMREAKVTEGLFGTATKFLGLEDQWNVVGEFCLKESLKASPPLDTDPGTFEFFRCCAFFVEKFHALFGGPSHGSPLSNAGVWCHPVSSRLAEPLSPLE
eukprot:symbB.v1.2.006160.t1/scaffold366.1/size218977/2